MDNKLGKNIQEMRQNYGSEVKYKSLQRYWHNTISKKICKAGEMTHVLCCASFGAPLSNEGVMQLESAEGSTETGSKHGEIILVYPCLFEVEKAEGKLQIYKELLERRKKFCFFLNVSMEI